MKLATVTLLLLFPALRPLLLAGALLNNLDALGIKVRRLDTHGLQNTKYKTLLIFANTNSNYVKTCVDGIAKTNVDRFSLP